jgi:DnaJ family protein C protein 8
MLVLRDFGLKSDAPNDHEKIKAAFTKEGVSPEEGLKDRVKKKAKEIMIDEELRRRRYVLSFARLMF